MFHHFLYALQCMLVLHTGCLTCLHALFIYIRFFIGAVKIYFWKGLILFTCACQMTVLLDADKKQSPQSWKVLSKRKEKGRNLICLVMMWAGTRNAAGIERELVNTCWYTHTCPNFLLCHSKPATHSKTRHRTLTQSDCARLIQLIYPEDKERLSFHVHIKNEIA